MNDDIRKKAKNIIAEKKASPEKSRAAYPVFDHKPTLVESVAHSQFNQMKQDILRSEFKPIREYSDLDPDSDALPHALSDFIASQSSKLLMAAKLEHKYEQELLGRLVDEYLRASHKEYYAFCIHATENSTFILLPFNLVDNLKKNIRVERRGMVGSVKSMAQH